MVGWTRKSHNWIFLFCSCIKGGAQKPKKKLDIHPNILKIELFAPQKKTQLREFSTVTFCALGSFFFRPRSRQETDWFSALGSFFFRPRSRSLSTPTNNKTTKQQKKQGVLNRKK